LIWFEFIHFCDIDLDSIYERNYAMYIEWTKLSERENRSLITQQLHVVETINWHCVINNEFIASIQHVMFIENMLYTLHATYIEHNLYADFSLRLERLLKENFSRQSHSSRWTRFLTAQISTVYFLSMNCRRFICNMHAYHSQFLL